MENVQCPYFYHQSSLRPRERQRPSQETYAIFHCVRQRIVRRKVPRNRTFLHH